MVEPKHLTNPIFDSSSVVLNQLLNVSLRHHLSGMTDSLENAILCCDLANRSGEVSVFEYLDPYVDISTTGLTFGSSSVPSALRDASESLK